MTIEDIIHDTVVDAIHQSHSATLNLIRKALAERETHRVEEAPPPNKLRQFAVRRGPGLAGEAYREYREYRVTTLNGNGIACTCPGFNFRGTCKHMTAMTSFDPDSGLGRFNLPGYSARPVTASDG